MISRSSLHVERRFRRRRWLAVACALAWLVCPRAALAKEPFDLDWQAPPGCPGEDEVRTRIESLVGQSPTGKLHAEGRVVRIDGRYQLTLSVRDAGKLRTRIIESESCADLAGAAAVALGLLVRGGSGAGASGAGAAAAGTRTSASDRPGAEAEHAQAERDTSGERAEPSPASASASGERDFSFVVRAPVAAVDFGSLPSPGFGFGAGLGVRYGGWRVFALGRMFIRQILWSRQVPDAGASVGRMTAELWTCREWRVAPLEIGPCVAAGVDRLAAHGTGANVEPASETSTVARLAAGLGTHLHVYDFLALVGTATIGVETPRPRVVVNGLGEVHRAGPVVLSLGLGVDWSF